MHGEKRGEGWGKSSFLRHSGFSEFREICSVMEAMN